MQKINDSKYFGRKKNASPGLIKWIFLKNETTVRKMKVGYKNKATVIRTKLGYKNKAMVRKMNIRSEVKTIYSRK